MDDINTSSPTQELPRELQAAILKHDTNNDRKEAREGWGATTWGMAITKECLGTLGEAFRVALAGGLRSDAAESKLLKVANRLDPDVLALCVMQASLHSIAVQRDLMPMALVVGDSISAECWAAGLIQTDEKRAKAIARRVRLAHASSALRLAAAKREAGKGYKKRNGDTVNPYEVREWSKDFKVRAGMWAVNVMTDALPQMFRWREEVVGTSKGAETTRYLHLTDHAWAIADAIISSDIHANPVWFPETSPPKPWTSWAGGGANDPRVNSVTRFLRSRHKDTGAAVRAAIKSGQMQPALDAVNALQDTAWAINQPMMDIVQECFDRGLRIKGLPPKDPKKPKRSKDTEWAEMTKQQRTLKKINDEAQRHAFNKAKCDGVLFSADMKQARELAKVERFWTPMNCDWRGRVYALSHFNFQRDDRIRSLFLFAEGEPLGDDGLYWLKVHVANCGAFNKIDKRPLEERVQWVDDNLSWISKNVEDPFRYVNWHDASKPFLFLSASRELIAAKNAGPSYVSRLPVSFDGSCSGLQHLSAMTRAAEGSLVNLTPAPLPQDVYATVAKLVNERLTKTLTEEPENPFDDEEVKTAAKHRALAQLALLFGIGRDECKRGVMTYAYSSKKFGMACQIQADLMQPLAEEVLEGKYKEHPFAPYDQGTKERPSAAARFLAEHIFESIEAIVHKPAEAMHYLQKLARAMAHEGKPLRWTTPVGIPWINRYHDPVTKRVELWLNDGGVRLRSQIKVSVDDKPEINKDAAANGVAPNFVHALDASHLLMVVLAARSRGITSIATVHDSFGCLPSRATEFNAVIRETFADLYEKHDVLGEVLAQAKCDLTDDNSKRLPDAIIPGPLNIKDILNAPFAFA